MSDCYVDESDCYVDEPCGLKTCCPCQRFRKLPVDAQRRRRLSHVMRTQSIIVELDLSTHIVTNKDLAREQGVNVKQIYRQGRSQPCMEDAT